MSRTTLHCLSALSALACGSEAPATTTTAGWRSFRFDPGPEGGFVLYDFGLRFVPDA